MRADGITPTSREERASQIIRAKIDGENGDIYITVPKVPAGMELDEEALARRLQPYIDELARPFRAK